MTSGSLKAVCFNHFLVSFTSPCSKQDLFVDFESSVPEGPEDWAVYNETEVLLTEAEIILAQLKNYKNGKEWTKI